MGARRSVKDPESREISISEFAFTIQAVMAIMESAKTAIVVATVNAILELRARTTRLEPVVVLPGRTGMLGRGVDPVFMLTPYFRFVRS